MEPSEMPNLVDETVVERINKDSLKPINDTAHEHQYQPDHDDETDEYIAMMCTVKNCGVGYLRAK